MKRALAALIAASALAAVTSGCGSSADAGPTKAEFIKRADSICTQMDLHQDEARDYYWDTHPGFLGTAQFKRELWGWETNIVEEVILPPIETGAKELEKLRIPGGDREEVDAIVTGMRKDVRKGLARPIQLLWDEGPTRPFAEVEKLAREYGFKACAKPL